MPSKALTFTASLNAYAIYKGAKKLGVDVFTTSNEEAISIPRNSSTNAEQWLCFTEEASLRKALNGEIKGLFFPRQFPIDFLDNKWAFADWLAGQDSLCQGVKQWPLSEAGFADFPFLIKAKHSWHGDRKLPRGWLCRSREDVKYARGQIEELNFSEDWFFVQQWLESDDLSVISVCGFFDHNNAHRNIEALVKRIASYQSGLSCSAAVETMNDQGQLIEKTHAILQTLEFTGPYEMEYLVSASSTQVLELNPRFWMQHAIFLKNGNGLLKRYFELDNETDWQQRNMPATVWVDGVELLRSILVFKFDLAAITVRKFFLKDIKVIIWPNLLLASKIVLKKAITKLKHRVFPTHGKRQIT